MEKTIKALCVANFAFAIGVLLPIAFVSYPSTFQQLAGIPFGEAFSPGNLGFLLVQLVLILLSAAGIFYLACGFGGGLTEIIIFILAMLAVLACIFNPYWLGYLSLFQNVYALVTLFDHEALHLKKGPRARS